MQISNPPTGDTNSVYTIDGNQTTILLDERSGKEKVLIRTHKGDFFHIDIDEQKLQAYFKSDIEIKTDAKLYITSKDEMHLATESKLFVYSKEDMEHKTDAKLHTLSKEDMHIKTKGTMFREAENNIEEKSGLDINRECVGNFNDKNLGSHHIDSIESINILSTAEVNIDGSELNEQGGASQPSNPAQDTIDSESAIFADPKGSRDT